MQLKHKLNLWDIFCIASGIMISSGLFILPSIVYRYAHSNIVISYFLAGIFMLPSVLSKAELITAMPKAGGTYFFIERSFGPFLGIFGGLAGFVSFSLKSAFALVGMGVFLEYFFPSVNYFQIKILAASLCGLFIIINLFSIKISARVQNVMVIFVISICFLYIILGLRKIEKLSFSLHLSELKSIFSVAGMVFISYGGLTKVASIAEDTDRPWRNIPLGMFLAFLVVQTIYVLCVGVTVNLLSSQEIISTFTPLTAGALKLNGLIFGVFLSLAALISFIATANAGIFTSSRIPLAMAKDTLLPSWFCSLSKKYQTPYFSIIFTGTFMISLILFLDLENLVKTASTLMLILFIFVNFSVIIMRESKIINYRPTFKSPFYPWIQIFSIFIYGFLILEMGKVPFLISISFVGLSLLWFFLYAGKIRREFALMHLVERITAKELVNVSLEEELKEILHQRDGVVKDRFDQIIEKCPVLDLKERIGKEEFFSLISGILSFRLDIEAKKIKELLLKREEESSTVVEKELALPHIVIEGENKFEIVVVRAKEGIIFSPQEVVKIVFVLAGTSDQRNFYLRSLMIIANIVREHHFISCFMKAKSKERLRLAILSSTRKRQL